jgi:hypothetical protein
MQRGERNVISSQAGSKCEGIPVHNYNEPQVHIYNNISTAKGSYLLIMPLDVWAEDH